MQPDSNYGFLSFADMDESQARQVYELRSSDFVRQWMFEAEKFSFEHHLSFIRALNTDPTRDQYYVSRGNVFIGVYTLAKLEGGKGQSGFYLSKDAADRGLAFEFLYRCIDFVFMEKNLQLLYGYQSVNNAGAQRLNKLMGFYESVERKVHQIDGEDYQFGMLTNEAWKEIRNRPKLQSLLAVSKRIN